MRSLGQRRKKASPGVINSLLVHPLLVHPLISQALLVHPLLVHPLMSQALLVHPLLVHPLMSQALVSYHLTSVRRHAPSTHLDCERPVYSGAFLRDPASGALRQVPSGFFSHATVLGRTPTGKMGRSHADLPISTKRRASPSGSVVESGRA
jgi:hypothetical protein